MRKDANVVLIVVTEKCTTFPSTMDDGPGICRGRCLTQFGKPQDDVIELSGILSLGNVTVDTNAVP